MPPDIDKELDLVPLNTYPLSVRQNLIKDIYNTPALPSRPDEEEFNDPSGFTMFSTGKLNDDTINYATEVAKKLVDKKVKFRYNGNTYDSVATNIYNSLEKGKMTFKPYPSFGDKSSDATIVLTKSTYDGHAIAAYTVNRINKVRGVKKGGGVGKQREEIEASDLNNREKIAALANIYNESVPKEDATFADLDPNQRSRKAYLSHLFFDVDCLTPVKCVIFATPDGARTLTEVYVNSNNTPFEDTSKGIVFQISMAEFLNIPAFNITNVDDRKKLEEFMGL